MALKQPIALPSGAAGDYLRIDVFEFNRRARRAYVQVALFANATRAMNYPDYPLSVVSILNLEDAKFDEYLGSEALALCGGNVLGQLYKAVRREKLSPVNGIVLSEIAAAEDV